MTGRRTRRSSGSMVIETLLWIPILLLLLMGMLQFGKITYVYYTLKKTLYTAGQYLASQQGVNFCDLAGDPTTQAAINFAFTGTTDGSAPSQFPTVTPDMIQITAECVDSNTQGVGDCSIGGCDGPGGAQRPDYIVVSIPNGYQITPRIPYILLDPFPLKPLVRVPFGGT